MDSLSEQISNQVAQMLSSGSPLQWIGALLVAYLGGVLSSLTPCVYPMIPITVSVMGGMGNKGEKGKGVVARGLAYVFGMAMVYSFLGVLAGLTGRVFGSFTQGASWYLILGLVMTIAALMMLDVIIIDPMALWNRIKSGTSASHVGMHKAGAPTTFVGAFVLGATSGFIAAPCTTPVLAAILSYIAKTQSVVFGMALMFSFSAGLGTLLLVIAGFAGALKVLPKSGQWMKWIKIFSGLLLLGFAEYLIYRSGQLVRGL